MLWSLVLLDDGQSRDVLWVVRREAAAPVLERRYLYKEPAGDRWLQGKPRGFTVPDLETVLKHLGAILDALRQE